MEPENTEVKRRRGIYLLPNLFTTGCLFAGFYAIVAAMNGRYEAAAIAIFVAMVMDTLDGRVARMTGTESDFGAQYDSLADMVSFGLAPGLIIYTWALSGMGKLGWLASFVYTACAALRLARFNTQVATGDKRYFQGLPSPAAAGVIVGMMWVGNDFEWDVGYLRIPAFLITIAIGLAMVSTIRYHSFKDLDLRGKVPFVAILIMVLIYALISSDPPRVLFSGFLLYAISGPLLTLKHLREKRAARKPPDEPGGDKPAGS